MTFDIYDLIDLERPSGAGLHLGRQQFSKRSKTPTLSLSEGEATNNMRHIDSNLCWLDHDFSMVSPLASSYKLHKFIREHAGAESKFA
jgi:hypothetical protein